MIPDCLLVPGVALISNYMLLSTIDHVKCCFGVTGAQPDQFVLGTIVYDGHMAGLIDMCCSQLDGHFREGKYNLIPS